MKFPQHRGNAASILDNLKAKKSDDLPWQSGKVFAYIFDAGDDTLDLVHDAYGLFLTENGLDPTSFPSLLELEKEVVGMALNLTQAPDSAGGSFTSGGTESILLAIKTARDFARANKPEITEPELVLPETAHAAFFKACSYFDVKPIVVPIDPKTFRAVPEAMAAAITENSIMMVGSTPSYAHGVIDPIRELASIAEEKGILFHVDACVGGFVLPFAKKLGYDIPDFDFSIPGVTSISMDIHKYGYAAKGASLVLHRDAAIKKYQIFSCASWSGYTVINPTILSSKSGGPIAAAWAAINHLGEEGYCEIVDKKMQASKKLQDGIAKIEGIYVLGEPDACMFSIAAEDFDIFPIAEKMKTKGWYIQPQLAVANSPENIHFSINGANTPHVDALLVDLEACVKDVRANQKPFELPLELTDDIMALLENLTPEIFDEVVKLLGSDGGDIPEHMEEVNVILNQMSTKAREEILKEFINRLYAPV